MTADIHQEKILILDFGSQYTQLIARRVRELKVYCEIHPFNHPVAFIKKFNPKGIILSGGPASVYDKGAPTLNLEVLNLDIPILGICYGMQVLIHCLKGKVNRAFKREYGRVSINIRKKSLLFQGMGKKLDVWMSHGDRIERLPEDFNTIADSDNSPHAAIQHSSKPLFGAQFHPEVIHTPRGKEIISNFAYLICKCERGG